MVSAKNVTKQLREIGCDYAVWGRSEIHELANILMDDEQMIQAVNGYYEGGFALLCVTNYRVLIVDKKPLALNVEDLRYDMIAEADYNSRIFTSALHLFTPMRTIVFTSWSMSKLRKSMNYVQQRVMELRNNDYLVSQFPQQQSAKDRGMTAGRMWQRQSVPQMVPTPAANSMPTSEFDAYRPPVRPMMNPYTKMPLLARRRRYPSFY